MRQLTLAAASFERYGRLTQRAAFLAEMERVDRAMPLWRSAGSVVSAHVWHYG